MSIKYIPFIQNSEKTKTFWDGTIRSGCNDRPKRLMIRNICGDETVWRV